MERLIELADLVSYLDSYLRISEVPDDPRALNGLQIENAGTVTKVVASVDACQPVIDRAIELKADLIIVHHGLFWRESGRIAGPYGRRIRALISRGVALYSAHIPLDCHPEVGNNFVLARDLGFRNPEPFGKAYDIPIGVSGTLETSREELVRKVAARLGIQPRVVNAGPTRVRRIGLVTGAGTSELNNAAAAGLDTFITGEGPHHSYLQAEDLGINLIYAGHYATETVGVQALAAHLNERFDLPWEFVDHPTGL